MPADDRERSRQAIGTETLLALVTPEDEPKPNADKSEKPPRRTRTAEIADAMSEGAERLGRLGPQQILVLISMLVVGFVCAMLAFQAYSERQERYQAALDRAEHQNAQIRENNAQTELLRQHCSLENEKAHKRADEQIQRVLTTFLAEGERLRVFQALENEKMRAEIRAAIKKEVNGP